MLENGDNNNPLNNRRTLIESDLYLQDRMKDLDHELRQARNTNPLDELDTIHETNKAKGMDKFKTLRQIRQGNTKKRVDAFESM